jgi:ankyrin repeat protein
MKVSGQMRLLLLLLTATLTVGALPLPGGEIVFTKDVKPILQTRCYACHGPDLQMGSLRLDQKERAMVAGVGAPAIVPGNSAESLVYRRISGGKMGPQMPLTGPLSAEEIATIKDWIDQGAKWPDEAMARPDWNANRRVDPLLLKIRQGEFSPVRAAIEADGNLVNARSANGTTLLMQAALYGSAQDVRWLLEKGANPNLASASGVTALMWAIEDAEKVRALIAKGADVNARSGDGQTAMLMASDQASDAEVIKALLEHGASATPDQGTDPLVMAARNADTKAMKLLVEQRGGIFPAEALTGAATVDCLACVQMILKGGYSKEILSAALRNAATTSSLEIINTLLAAGADINWQDSTFGATALIRAAYSDYADTERVKLLLDRGADINIRDSKGDTALRIAKRKGATKVVAMLVSAGAKE